MTIRIAHTLDLTIGTSEDEPKLNLITVVPATEKQTHVVLKADAQSMDGRSNWLIFHLPNGDTIFGCYPEGDTYEVMTNG